MPCRSKRLNAIAADEQGGQRLYIQINMTGQLALFLQERTKGRMNRCFILTKQRIVIGIELRWQDLVRK